MCWPAEGVLIMNKALFLTPALLAAAISAQADLVALDDASLSETTGEGLGMALENFVFNVDDAVTTVTGIESSDGSEVNVAWTEFYIMGEGSNNGTTEVAAQIGSVLHPWVLQSVRGSRGLADTDASYNADYLNFGSDIALLELATDQYDNPVENIVPYSQFSLYQGCVWGQPGCTTGAGANGVAVQKIDAEIAGYQADRTEIDNRYTNLVQINQTIIDDASATGYIGVAEQERDDAKAVSEASYDDMSYDYYNVLNSSERGEIKLGQRADCGTFGLSCSSREQTYNSSVDQYDEDFYAYVDKIKALTEAYNDPDRSSTGVSYIQRVRDIGRFRVLCGSDLSSSECTAGLIARKQETRDGIASVSVALGSGVTRRGGLDIGSKFAFTLNSTDQDGNVTERTDFLDIDMKGVYFDGSHFRLWSRPDENGQSELNGELSLNLYAKEMNINVCGEACEGDATLTAESTLYLDNFAMSLNLGYGEIQPMKFGVTSDGNFEFELVKPDAAAIGVDTSDPAAMQEFYNSYYENAPKSFIYVGNVQVGTGAGSNLGSITVDGLRSQYLKVTSRDI